MTKYFSRNKETGMLEILSDDSSPKMWMQLTTLEEEELLRFLHNA